MWKQTRIKASILYKQQYQMASEDLKYMTIQKFVVSKIWNVLFLNVWQKYLMLTKAAFFLNVIYSCGLVLMKLLYKRLCCLIF